MKKVLFVLKNMNIGGTEKAFLNMVDILSPKEYEITLMLLEKKGGFLDMIPEWINIEVMDDYATMKSEIMEPPLQVLKKNIRMGHIIKTIGLAVTHLIYKITDDRTMYYRFVLQGKKLEKEYDIAIAYCGPFDFLTVYVLYFVKALRKIQWIHFDVSKLGFNTKMCRKLYPKFQDIFVVSDEAKEKLLNLLPDISNKTRTFLNIVSYKQCKLLAEKGSGYADEFAGIRIVTIGRLSEEKGQDIIPEIALKLSMRGIVFRWYLIGDGKLRGIIEEKVKKYNMSQQIIFLGTQSNPYPYLKEADIYVQTSKHEGYCITLAEAKVFDLPIVSTDCAGAHEQLSNRNNSYIVKRDVESMTTAIEALIKKHEYLKCI